MTMVSYQGMFLHECTLAGEQRRDGVFPGHPNGCQLARDRFLIVYATRGFRCTDDDRSIVAQVRACSYHGPILSETMIQAVRDDWDPGQGSRCTRQTGHALAFGVPCDAEHQGQPLPHANVFAISWRVTARVLGANQKLATTLPPNAVQFVEWAQVRLNKNRDALEIVTPPTVLRQVGHAGDERFCQAAVSSMNQTFVQPVPMDASGRTWLVMMHFHAGHGGQVGSAVCGFEFNEVRKCYEWTRMGPMLGDAAIQPFECSILPWRGEWLIHARLGGGTEQRVAWYRLRDPWRDNPQPVFPSDRLNNAPLTAYACPDGVVRALGGDVQQSPYHHGRNPLLLWEIDPDRNFTAVKTNTVLDCVTQGLLRRDQMPRAEMGKLLPHSGGAAQQILFRVRPKATQHAGSLGDRAVQPIECAVAGLYRAELDYPQAWPGAWDFGVAARQTKGLERPVQ